MSRKPPAQRPGKSVQSVRTPAEFLAAVRRRLGIDAFAVDLAASRSNTVAPKFYSARTNALVHPWPTDGWNWANPEFSDLRPWVEKAYEESKRGARTAMLVPAAVGANWWRDFVDGKAHVLLLNGRITFVGHKQPYPKDCSLLLFAGYKAGDAYNRDLSPGYEVWAWAADVRKAAA